MPTTTRFSVAKTQRSYSPLGVNAVLGSTVKSETEQWTGGIAYGSPEAADPKSQSTTRLAPTS
jgi:hypothetical protein